MFFRFIFATYRRLISPLIHALPPLFGASSGCRFDPSCSTYAEQALREHGFGRGFRLAGLRLLRCHPLRMPLWLRRGKAVGIYFDPVPRRAAEPDLAQSSET